MLTCASAPQRPRRHEFASRGVVTPTTDTNPAEPRRRAHTVAVPVDSAPPIYDGARNFFKTRVKRQVAEVVSATRKAMTTKTPIKHAWTGS